MTDQNKFLEEIGYRFLMGVKKKEKATISFQKSAKDVFLKKFAWKNEPPTNSEIAKEMNIQKTTVDKHLNAIYAAFNKSNGGPLTKSRRGEKKFWLLHKWLWEDEYPRWREEQERKLSRSDLDDV